jgi:hypothetical protein
MQEWWTYSPSDFLMFSARTYYRLFELHNRRMLPGQVVALVVGAGVVWLLWRGTPRGRRVAVALVAAAWAIVAGTYFLLSYASIHTFARWFAAAFAVQAVVLLAWTTMRSPPVAGHGPGRIERIGAALVAAAVLAQPLIGPLLGRPWTQTELFGIAPDPTVTATFGALLALPDARWWLWIVPVAWSLFTGMTLFTLGSPDAFVVPVVAVTCSALGVARSRRGRNV